MTSLRKTCIFNETIHRTNQKQAINITYLINYAQFQLIQFPSIILSSITEEKIFLRLSPIVCFEIIEFFKSLQSETKCCNIKYVDVLCQFFQLVKTRQCLQTRSQPLQEQKSSDGAEDGGESRGDDAMGAVLSIGVVTLVGIGGGGAEALGDVVAQLGIAVAGVHCCTGVRALCKCGH